MQVTRQDIADTATTASRAGRFWSSFDRAKLDGRASEVTNGLTVRTPGRAGLEVTHFGYGALEFRGLTDEDRPDPCQIWCR